MKILDLIRRRSTPFYSLEFFPPKEREDWPAFFEQAARLKAMNPLFASVTCGAGGSTQSNTLEIATRLKHDHDVEPMPHLTCVGATEERIAQSLEQFRCAGLDNLLALRGDRPRDAGPDWRPGTFSCAENLVRFVRDREGDFGVGVAGYPAPHPESSSFYHDREYLRRKIEAGADFVITQLFFDTREYFELVTRLRGMGIEAPVLPGVLPIQSLASIRRTLSLCGANIPGKFYLELEEAHDKGGTEAVKETGLKFAVAQIRRLLDGGAPGIHLYTLNRSGLCLRIAEEVGTL